MKELSIEEKARRYESALEKCRKLYKEAKANEYTSDIEDYETIFPELRENEDEVIRKWLYSYFRSLFPTWIHRDITCEEILAWLEKQDKNIQVMCPTFTFDDIFALQCCMGTVKKVQEDKELYGQLQSLHNRLHDAYWLGKQGQKKYIDDLTQQEAMDIAVAKCFEQGGQKPADKVEPKIENTRPLLSDFFNAEYERGKADALKSVEWSEEDEIGWTNTMIMIKETASNHYTKDSIKLVTTWLKSIKERIGG